jgi:hypothetical protein
MTMGGHGNQVTLSGISGLEDSVGGIPPGQNGGGFQTLGLKLQLAFFQIVAVAAHLFGFTELLLMARLESIGDMNKCQPGMKERGQFSDVCENNLIGRGIFQRD